MATECLALPAPLGFTLAALAAAEDALDAAEQSHLLALSTLTILQDRGTTGDALTRAQVATEIEAHALHTARAVHREVARRVRQAAQPYLPANDQHEAA
jgi:hypothetical protein